MFYKMLAEFFPLFLIKPFWFTRHVPHADCSSISMQVQCRKNKELPRDSQHIKINSHCSQTLYLSPISLGIASNIKQNLLHNISQNDPQGNTEKTNIRQSLLEQRPRTWREGEPCSVCVP